MFINDEAINIDKQAILNLFVDYFKKNNDTNHLLGMLVCGSFKNNDNTDFSDIDIQIIMDESYNENPDFDKSSGSIVRGVELIDNYKFEYFVRNITGYYDEALEAHQNQRTAILTIVGYGQIFFYKNEESLNKIKKMQNSILNLYSKPFPPVSSEQLNLQLISIYKKIDLLLKCCINNSNEFTMNYFLVLEEIRKFYSRSMGCCYLPPAKVWKIYNDKEYADRFCKSKIPDDEFILEFSKCITSEENIKIRIENIQRLISLCKRKLNLEKTNNISNENVNKETDNRILEKDEVLEFLVILENRRTKLNEKYIKNERDYEYFYFIVLQMIDEFCLKINNSINVIDEDYQSLYYLAKVAVESSEKNEKLNSLLDYIEEKYQKEYSENIDATHYRVLIKSTTWNRNK